MLAKAAIAVLGGLLIVPAAPASDLSKYLHPAEPQFVLLQTGTTTTTRTSTSTTTTTTGGGGRVQARAVLTSGAAGYGAVQLAYNADNDQYLAVWVEDDLIVPELAAEAAPAGSEHAEAQAEQDPGAGGTDVTPRG